MIEWLIKHHNRHLLCLVEAGLHGQVSKIGRRNHIITQGIMSIMCIEGYRIILQKLGRPWPSMEPNVCKGSHKGYWKSDTKRILRFSQFHMGIWIGREKKTTVILENGHMHVWFKLKGKEADPSLEIFWEL